MHFDSCFGGFRHGFETPCLHGFGCSGIAMAADRGDSVPRGVHVHCSFALQLLYSRSISFRLIAYFSPPARPLPVCTYLTPGRWRTEMGVFLALGGGPECASCRPLFGLPLVVGSPKHSLQLPSLCFYWTMGVDVWRMKH